MSNSKQIGNPDSLGPRAKQVLDIVFKHKKITNREVAKQLGISEQRVSQIRNHEKFVACLPAKARRVLKEAIPELSVRYLELGLQNENLGVAEKAVARVLDSQKVLENQAPTTQINVFQGMSTSELKQKLEQIRFSPTDAVDAEIVDDPGSTRPD